MPQTEMLIFRQSFTEAIEIITSLQANWAGHGTFHSNVWVQCIVYRIQVKPEHNGQRVLQALNTVPNNRHGHITFAQLLIQLAQTLQVAAESDQDEEYMFAEEEDEEEYSVYEPKEHSTPAKVLSTLSLTQNAMQDKKPLAAQLTSTPNRKQDNKPTAALASSIPIQNRVQDSKPPAALASSTPIQNRMQDNKQPAVLTPNWMQDYKLPAVPMPIQNAMQDKPPVAQELLPAAPMPIPNAIAMQDKKPLAAPESKQQGNRFAAQAPTVLPDQQLNIQLAALSLAEQPHGQQ